MGLFSKRYLRVITTPVFFLLSVFFIGCKENNSSVKKSITVVAKVNPNYIKKLIEGNPVIVDSLDIFNVSSALRLSYSNSNYHPFWVSDAPVFNNVSDLLLDINGITDDGLSLEPYNIKSIHNTLEKIKKSTATEEELAVFDTLCTYSYLLAAKELLLGRINSLDVDTEWLHRNDTSCSAVAYLNDSLYTANSYPSLSLYKSKLSTYLSLKAERKKYTRLEANIAFRELKKGNAIQLVNKGYKSFLHPEMLENEEIVKELIAQHYEVSLPDIYDSTEESIISIKDSVVNKIDVNLERLRWLPQEFEDAYLIVNVPAMNLYLNIDNKDTMHMRVVIGKKSRATPTMSADMVNLVFNPTWTVPPGIMKKDIIPGMNNKGSSYYLAKKGLAVFTHSGKELNPDSIDVTKANFKKFVFRQPPGYKNALGRVKFNLPNKHNIYLHDTPSRSDFKKKKRAKSSGCIRVQHPRDMAGYILRKINNEEDSKRFVDSIINRNKMVFVPLKKHIPVHILYLTATEDSAKQHVVYLDDVYDKDEAIAKRLK